jgi:predicted small lipoprotein YifL
MRKIILTASVAGLLAACGTKGPLTLPLPKPNAPPTTGQIGQPAQPNAQDDSTRAGNAT